MSDNHKTRFKFENTLGEKMEITLKVREKNGNVTFLTMSDHVKRFINNFPDTRNIKEFNFAKSTDKGEKDVK